ncbi:hypothetical protein LOAG_07970 [Loa loa]|uniref:Uncharacterized protein n=1 Tax=Loa loa TaxID=7209 RepID=A0A1S0TWD1_LOALO|nr:hypothetical protein LOAG_07970 [Loa loa]EFO20522.1 hypothetical protein LOAG_07970 [Loa loa]
MNFNRQSPLMLAFFFGYLQQRWNDKALPISSFAKSNHDDDELSRPLSTYTSLSLIKSPVKYLHTLMRLRAILVDGNLYPRGNIKAPTNAFLAFLKKSSWSKIKSVPPLSRSTRGLTVFLKGPDHPIPPFHFTIKYSCYTSTTE